MYEGPTKSLYTMIQNFSYIRTRTVCVRDKFSGDLMETVLFELPVWFVIGACTVAVIILLELVIIAFLVALYCRHKKYIYVYITLKTIKHYILLCI